MIMVSWFATPCCGTTTAPRQDALDLIAELGGPQAWADAVGSVPVASFTVSKIRWLARHEPENAARVQRVILPHDYLTWEIGGRSFDPVTDRGDASGTAYFDGRSNSYRDDLVELAFGRTLELPRVAAPDEVVGESPEGMKIGPGTGDNAASVLGMVVPDRTALVSLGTSGVACLRSDVQTHDPTGVVAGFADATGRLPAAGLHAQRGPQPGGHGQGAQRLAGRVQRAGRLRASPAARGWSSCPTWKANGRRRFRTARVSCAARP